jgi:hypothetical protein
MRLFSYRDRPVHLGPFPLERLPRAVRADLSRVPPMRPLAFVDAARPESIVNAMTRYMAMFDAVRDGKPAPLAAEIPADPQARSEHLKSAGYYFDASQVGVCAVPAEALLPVPFRTPGLDAIVDELNQGQPKTHAAGIDGSTPTCSTRRGPSRRRSRITATRSCSLVEYTRDPRPASRAPTGSTGPSRTGPRC